MVDGSIKFRHLQCFLAVAQHGSLQKAAGSLSISQPAVSKTLKELEALLATRLFARGRRGAALTAAGEAFARHAGHSVSALRDAVASVAQLHHDAQAVVTLGVLPTVAPDLMARVLQRLDSQVSHDVGGVGPAVSLRVLTGSNPALLNQLRQGELDAVIGRFAEPAQMPGLTFEHLYAEPLVLAVRPGHPLLAVAARGEDVLQQLPGFTVILPVKGTAIRQAADTCLLQHGAARLGRTLETLSVSLARDHTAASNAVCLFPLGALAAELARGTLTRLPVQLTGSEERVGLILRADQAAPAALQPVIASIRQVAELGRAQTLAHPPAHPLT